MLKKMMMMAGAERKMMLFLVASFVVVTGTLAQGIPQEFDRITEDLGPLEVTKEDEEVPKELNLRLPQESDVAAAIQALQRQEEAALAAIEGTRRRGSHRNTTTETPNIPIGCVTEGAVFAEGSAMVSPDECSYCFCIRGKQRCVAPKCLLPVEGCRPRYRSFSCCPSFYDCHDASTTTTTTSKPPAECIVNGVTYSHGSLVSEGTGGTCQNCYCFNGHVNCTTITCAPALEGCKPIMQEGHCCPVKYDCDDGHRRVTVDDFLKDFQAKLSTAGQRKPYPRKRPEWHTNMARKSPGGETIISDADQEQSSSAEPSLQADITLDQSTSDDDLEVSESEDISPDEPITDETQDPEEETRPRRPNRKRLSGRITRPSAAAIANRRKQTRYTPQRLGSSPSRAPSQNLGLRFRQRIKLNKNRLENEENQEGASKSSTISPSTPESNNSILNKRQTEVHNASDDANELDTIIREESDSITAVKDDNTPIQESQIVQEPNSRTTTQKSITRPSTQRRRRPFRPRLPAVSLSERIRQRTRGNKEKIQTTATQELTSSTTKFNLPPSESTTESIQNTTIQISEDDSNTIDRQKSTSSTTKIDLTSSEFTTETMLSATNEIGDETSVTLDSFETTQYENSDYSTVMYEDTTSIIDISGTSENPIPITEQSKPTTNNSQKLFKPSRIGTPYTSLSERLRQSIKENEAKLKEFSSTDSFTFPTTTDLTTPTSVQPISKFISSTRQSEIEADPQTTLQDNAEFVTNAYEDTTIAYNSVPGIFDIFTTSENLEDIVDSKFFISALDAATPPPIRLTSSSTTTLPSSDTNARISTTTESTLNLTPKYEDEVLPEVVYAEYEDDSLPETLGHPGEVHAVEDISNPDRFPFESPQPLKLDVPIKVGTGVNVKGDLDDAVAFGPILIHDNRVRTDRQNKILNTTDVEEPEVENTAATDIPEDTTMVTIEETKIPEDAATIADSTDYDTEVEDATTLFPIQDTTIKPTSNKLQTKTTYVPTTITEESPVETKSETSVDIPGGDLDYSDIETAFPSYDITVGTSVMTTNQARPSSSGVGQVFPVDLEPEHKAAEVESGPPVENERPSLFGTLLNILTRTDSRPTKLPPPPPPPPGPPRLPFRPRPRPNLGRPPFIPPRFRPSPRPELPLERETTEEPEIATSSLTEQPTTTTIKITSPIVLATTEPISTINKPVSGFSRPKPVVNSPIESFTQSRPNRPSFTPNQPATAIPIVNIPTNDAAGLPSAPVIEGGFQAMDDEGVQPNFDYEIENENPTLPPSLPNLKIIPFVASDAVVNREIGIAGDDFKPPLILTQTDDENQENQRITSTTESTTTATTTTTRRPFNRQSIIGTRRPLPALRRPGTRPFANRPIGFKPPTNRNDQDRTENKPADSENKKPSSRPGVFPFPGRGDRPITRPPFIPPRRPTITTDTTTPRTTSTAAAATTTTATTTTTTTTSTRRPPPSLVNTGRPFGSEDITNLLLLQDEFLLPGSQNVPPVRFSPDRSTRKPILPLVKSPPILPVIPDSVKDQLPLAADPLFISGGELKLSGCNVYGRMYEVGAKIKELSKGCKECRCTPVGVQCLPKPSC